MIGFSYLLLIYLPFVFASASIAGILNGSGLVAVLYGLLACPPFVNHIIEQCQSPYRGSSEKALCNTIVGLILRLTNSNDAVDIKNDLIPAYKRLYDLDNDVGQILSNIVRSTGCSRLFQCRYHECIHLDTRDPRIFTDFAIMGNDLLWHDNLGEYTLLAPPLRESSAILNIDLTDDIGELHDYLKCTSKDSLPSWEIRDYWIGSRLQGFLDKRDEESMDYVVFERNYVEHSSDILVLQVRRKHNHRQSLDYQQEISIGDIKYLLHAVVITRGDAFSTITCIDKDDGVWTDHQGNNFNLEDALSYHNDVVLLFYVQESSLTNAQKNRKPIPNYIVKMNERLERYPSLFPLELYLQTYVSEISHAVVLLLSILFYFFIL